MFWSQETYMTWRIIDALQSPPPPKRRRVEYDDPLQVIQVIGPDYEPRYDYDPKFAAGEDNYGVVVVENDTETIHMRELRFSMEKWWGFKDVHGDIKGSVYLNIVESGKWIGNEIQYFHAERVMLLVDNVSQLTYPHEVPMCDWYPKLLHPQDQMRSGFVLVTDHS